MDPDRLTGWKEIAAHLRKGIRTVQRWEKDYGLPVHRIGDQGGEIVFAFRSEIADWERSASVPEVATRVAESAAEPPTPQPSATSHLADSETTARWKSHRLLYAGVAVAVLTGAAFSLAGWLRGTPVIEMRDWTVQSNALSILGPQGVVLWTHRFEVPVRESAYASLHEEHNLPPGAEPVKFVDLDADGKKEVLVTVYGAAPADHSLLCLETDGRVRFRFKWSDHVNFGDTEYNGPWMPYRTFPLRTADGTTSVWAVFIHGRWFPTAVVEIDRFGTAKQRYWSNGYVSLVTAGQWNGREKIMIGAANNEHHGASLAMFDRDAVRGSAPAALRQYACTTCPESSPEEFLVFPGACILGIHEGTADVLRLEYDGGKRLAALVTHGEWQVPGTPGPWRPGIWYEFGPNLSFDRPEVTPQFRKIHEKLQRDGLIDHEFAADDLHSGLPVLRWRSGKFVQMPPTSSLAGTR